MTGFPDNHFVDELASNPSTIPQAMLRAAQTGSGDAWTRLVTKYFPMVYSWCRKVGLQPADSADVTQDVFRGIVLGINRFHREEQKATFRGWIRRITQRRIIDYRKTKARQGKSVIGMEITAQVQEAIDSWPYENSTSFQANHETMQGIWNIQAEFEPTTWQAFYRTTVDESLPSDVAKELGISLNAVYLAKSRVLKRLRTGLRDVQSNRN